MFLSFIQLQFQIAEEVATGIFINTLKKIEVEYLHNSRLSTSIFSYIDFFTGLKPFSCFQKVLCLYIPKSISFILRSVKHTEIYCYYTNENYYCSRDD